MAPKPAVVVLGGGISGISASLELLEHGYPVTLVETRQFLGGRAFSFTDSETGADVDNGQHVIVGCCTYFRDFINRLGVSGKWYLQPKLYLPVRDRRGNQGILKSGGLPPPFHLLGSFLTYPHLDRKEKLRALLALARARFTNRHQDDLEQTSFYHWLKQQGQSERAIQNFWNLLVKPTLNDDVQDVSAAMGLMIVQEGMLNGYHNSDLGYPLHGLLPSVGKPAQEHLSALGCRLMLGLPVKKVQGDEKKVSGVELASGERIQGDIFLSALPPNDLLRVLPQHLAEGMPFFQLIAKIEASPIVNVHLWYDRMVMSDEFLAFVDSPLQWVFNKSQILKDRSSLGAMSSGGQYISISISAAWEYIERDRNEVAAEIVREMADVFPAAREASVVRSVVVKQRNATFRCLPGVNLLRPSSATPIPNLFLAGEWTDTGWPSTMESAVRSGYNAARAISSSVAGRDL